MFLDLLLEGQTVKYNKVILAQKEALHLPVKSRTLDFIVWLLMVVWL
jgi:hypothetical protein